MWETDSSASLLFFLTQVSFVPRKSGLINLRIEERGGDHCQGNQPPADEQRIFARRKNKGKEKSAAAAFWRRAAAAAAARAAEGSKEEK